MSDSPYPSQTQDKFVLRLPDGMRDRIKRAAEANNRSMNAEIVATLEREYPESTGVELLQEILSEWERRGGEGMDDYQTRAFVARMNERIEKDGSIFRLEVQGAGKVRLSLSGAMKP